MYAWWAKVHWILKSWTWLSNRACTCSVHDLVHIFSPIWELMEQYMSKYADWHHHFYWLQWSQRTHGELMWRWHNWFRSDLAKRDTVACIQSWLSHSADLPDPGIKRKLRFSSDPQRVHCLVSESLDLSLLWPNLLVLCCPLCPCPQSPRSSSVPGSSQALFTARPPTPFPSPLLPLGLTVA